MNPLLLLMPESKAITWGNSDYWDGCGFDGEWYFADQSKIPAPYLFNDDQIKNFKSDFVVAASDKSISVVEYAKLLVDLGFDAYFFIEPHPVSKELKQTIHLGTQTIWPQHLCDGVPVGPTGMLAFERLYQGLSFAAYSTKPATNMKLGLFRFPQIDTIELSRLAASYRNE